MVGITDIGNLFKKDMYSYKIKEDYSISFLLPLSIYFQLSFSIRTRIKTFLLYYQSQSLSN